MDKQQVTDYVNKNIPVGEPNRVISVAQADNGDYYVTYKDEQGRPIRGGPFFLVKVETGDVLSMSRFGSGMGYNILKNCIDKFYSDDDFRSLLKAIGVVSGNVKEDVYNG